MNKRILALVLLLATPLAVHAGDAVNIEDLMTHREFREAGLEKLSPEEMAALNRWLGRYAGEREAAPAEAKGPEEKAEETLAGEGEKVKTYRIQRVSRETSFEINNRKFEAQAKCPGFSKGDSVVFIEGSAYGLCTTALFRKAGGEETCKVWCEER